MKGVFLRYRVLGGVLVALLYSAESVPVVAATQNTRELKETPQLTARTRENFQVNLARANLGADIKSSRPGNIVENVLGSLGGEEANTSEFGLISSDSSISYPLPAGDTSFIITLPFLSANNLFTFMNDSGGQGKVQVSIASTVLDFDSPKWKKVGESVAITGNGPVSVSFPMTEGMAVKIDYQMTKAGRINGFGIFGEARNSGLVEKPEQVKEIQPISQIVNYNYADITTTNAAKVSHVSSFGPSYELAYAQRMIDANNASYYDFAPEDTKPIVVVDLGFTESIRRISAVYETGPGVLEFYVMNKLPDGNEVEGDDSKGPRLLVIPEDFFTKHKPFRVVDTDTEKRKASTTFDLTPMRYIMLRWVPDSSATALLNPHPDRLIASTNGFAMIPFILGQVAAPANGVRVMEISAFGNTMRRRYSYDRSRERALTNAVKPSTEIPKDPPILPPVSP